VKVKKGQVIGLLNGKLVVSNKTVANACKKVLDKASAQDYERITVFYGEDISIPQVNEIVDMVREIYPSHEIEVHEGGQAHYQLIIAIE